MPWGINMKLNKETKRAYYLNNIYDTAGTYTLNIHRDDDYEIELYGGGGGSASHVYTSASAANVIDMCSGGSGAGFRGVVTLAQGAYTLTIGSAGAFGPHNSSTSEGGTGGTTTLQGIISVGGGTGGYCRGSASGISERIAGVGGTVQILDNTKIVSSSLSSSGNDGEIVRTTGTTSFAQGGASLFNNNIIGYGAGGSRLRAEISNDVYPAQAGYFRIYRVPSAEDYDYYTDNVDFYNAHIKPRVYVSNVTVSGSVEINEGIAYGYGTGQLSISSSFTLEANNILTVKFKLNSYPTNSTNMIFGGNSYIYIENKRLGLKDENGSVLSNYDLNLNTYYWAKIENGQLYISENGSSWTSIASLASLTGNFTYYTIFCAPIDAYFDLTECTTGNFKCYEVVDKYYAFNL